MDFNIIENMNEEMLLEQFDYTFTHGELLTGCTITKSCSANQQIVKSNRVMTNCSASEFYNYYTGSPYFSGYCPYTCQRNSLSESCWATDAIIRTNYGTRCYFRSGNWEYSVYCADR